MYYNGQGVTQDYSKAFEWYKKAAEQGFPNAQFRLGVMYCSGTGVNQDLSAGIMYFKKAAEQKYELAYNELAWSLHLIGQYEETLPWAEKAAKCFSEDDMPIDTLATVYKDLGRLKEALKYFELCLKLQRKQNASNNLIHETEEKIATLKDLMKNGGVLEQ